MNVALVVQRYGAEVHGGAETLARRMAELLVNHVELEVLTTCALDYLSWSDHYPIGADEVNGVPVRRFSVPEPRDIYAFEEASRAAYEFPDDLVLGHNWMRAQGPNSPDLLRHLLSHHTEYDAAVFVTYLYATTANGLPLAADRAILVPTLHDEPPLRLRIFDELFARARLCLFSTPEEHELARERFDIPDERSRIVGAGVDEYPEADASRFVVDTGIRRPYALYHGRLDPSKGVPELLAFHAKYRSARPDGLDLVLLGGGSVDLPERDGLHALGFVSEDVKQNAIAGAEVVVCPSPYESLSFSQLEAWSHGRPTLANGASPVLVGQSRRAGGGLWYSGADEYTAMLDLLTTAKALGSAIGAQGRRYVRAKYSWDNVRDSWLAALEEVAG
jgi:glycosyltransferase involved in cell wall biosynthesis